MISVATSTPALVLTVATITLEPLTTSVIFAGVTLSTVAPVVVIFVVFAPFFRLIVRPSAEVTIAPRCAFFGRTMTAVAFVNEPPPVKTTLTLGAMSLAAPEPAFTTTVVFVTAILRSAPVAGLIEIDFADVRLTVPTTRAGAFVVVFGVVFAVFVVLTRLFSIS